MRVKLRLFYIVLLCCGCLSGCKSDNALKAEIDGLKVQVIELQKSIADVNLRMEEVSNTIFILQEQAKANREAVKSLTQPKIYIQGETPTQSHSLLNESVTPAPLPQGGRVDENFNTAPTANVSGGLATALSNYRKRNYGLAVFDFNSYLSKNQTGPNTEKALFFLGMSYFSLNEFAQAVREWKKLIMQFPSSSFAAETNYRIGLAYQAMGQDAQAKRFFTLTIQKHQGSEWAARAAAELKQ